MWGAGLALAALAVAAPAPAQTSGIALGIEALARRDVRAADAAFAQAARSENVALRPIALQWRAHVAWRLRGDTAAAKRHLEQALSLARYNSQILLEVARLQAERRRYSEATRTALEAVRTSADAERRGLAVRTLVSLAADGAFAAAGAGQADSVDSASLMAVRDTLIARVERFPGRTTDAFALMNLAVLLGDSALTEKALGSYRALRYPDIQTFAARAGPRTLAGTLAEAGLYEQTALLLRRDSAAVSVNPWLRDVKPYAMYLRETRRAIERVHRSALAGTARTGDVSRAINAHGRRLWRTLSWPEAPPTFFPSALNRELARRFGTVTSIERSRGTDELHLAHRIGTYTVSADGREGTVVVLDGTVMNGMDAWLLDGAGGRVGWVSGDTIYARRTGFTEVPFRALVALNDPQSMPGEQLRLMRDSIGDIERALRDSLAYLPGVATRVFRAGSMTILDSLNRIDAMTALERDAAFARELFNSLTVSSIVLHESRHLADARSQRERTEISREFRAKLDEVIGAPRPRLAMTAILSPNIGDASSHGQANRRIMLGLARWIRQNGNAIEGYDVARPALLHLPSLTDAQLVAAFRSMMAP